MAETQKAPPLNGPIRPGSIVDGVVSLGEVAGAPDQFAQPHATGAAQTKDGSSSSGPGTTQKDEASPARGASLGSSVIKRSASHPPQDEGAQYQ
jgi:hypothetical protein